MPVQPAHVERDPRPVPGHDPKADDHPRMLLGGPQPQLKGHGVVLFHGEGQVQVGVGGGVAGGKHQPAPLGRQAQQPVFPLGAGGERKGERLHRPYLLYKRWDMHTASARKGKGQGMAAWAEAVLCQHYTLPAPPCKRRHRNRGLSAGKKGRPAIHKACVPRSSPKVHFRGGNFVQPEITRICKELILHAKSTTRPIGKAAGYE